MGIRQSVITEIIQRSHQFHHLQSLPTFRCISWLWVVSPAVYPVICLQLIEEDDFILEQFVDEQGVDLVEVHHVAADNTAGQLTQQCVVLTPFVLVPDCLFDTLLLPQSAHLQVDQVQLLHLFPLTQRQNSLRPLFLPQRTVSFGRLVKIAFFHIILIEHFLHILILSLHPFLLSLLGLILLEDAGELIGLQQCLPDTLLLQLLLSEPVILGEVVIDTHVATQVDSWQFALRCHLLRQARKIVRSFASVEERMARTGGLLAGQIAQHCPGGQTHLYTIFMKGKKMVTEASREQKRTLRIAQSPKKITKLKLGSMLQASKQRELEQINEAIREKLDHGPQTATSMKGGFNPYEAIYQNDLAYWREYSQSTGRYEQGGINLKWPYYFTAQQQEERE